MTVKAKERMELIRSRMNAVTAFVRSELKNPAGMYASQNPDAGVHALQRFQVAVSLARPGWQCFPGAQTPFGTVITPKHQVQWIAKPDGQAPVLLRRRHAQGKSPLVAIAEQEPEKPLRVQKYTWQTADVVMASHNGGGCRERTGDCHA